MPDQAATLRAMVGRKDPYAKVLTFASGKGGVGKSNIAANLAIDLAGRDLKIALLDMDLGLANIDILLGMTSQYNLTHVMAGQRSITDIVLPGPNNIMFIPGASGVSRLANLSGEEREFLIASFADMQKRADLLLVDTGAGISDNVLRFALSSQALVVVTTPEPTARMDAYALIKTVHREGGGATPVHVIVNETRDAAEGEQVFQALAAVCQKHLSRPPEYLGHVPCDPALPRAVKERRPLILRSPDCPAAKALRKISREMQRVFLPGTALASARAPESLFARVLSLLPFKASS